MKIISKIFFVFISILLFLQFFTVKVYPGWFKHYGGTGAEKGYSIQQTSDGGYIVTGFTDSYTYGSRDFAIYKLNSNGNKVWFKHYGGVSGDYGRSIQQTSDGGYIVAGYSYSYTYGDYDIAIYKLNSSGNKVWFKHYGGTQDDYGNSIQQTSDGGYIVAGYTESYTHGGEDFAIYKLNSNGNKVWFKHYGGTNYERAHSIQQTSDSGFIVAGDTYSYTYGNNDFAIYKLDSNGNKVWFKHYGGTNYDEGKSIEQTSEGGYILGGSTWSYTNGKYDFAIYKLDSNGNKVWFKHYGGSQSDMADSIKQTTDGGYIVAGYTGSFTYGSGDFAIYKLNSSGDKVWFKNYGGTSNDSAYSIQQTSDGGYIIVGETESYTYGYGDFAIYKLDSAGNK